MRELYSTIGGKWVSQVAPNLARLVVSGASPEMPTLLQTAKLHHPKKRRSEADSRSCGLIAEPQPLKFPALGSSNTRGIG
jgi:hypothetical protein